MNARFEITTHIGCPMNCVDCPQALLRNRYNGKRDLSFEDYKAVIDKLPKGIRVDFSGMCEPFCNKSCTDMILYDDAFMIEVLAKKHLNQYTYQFLPAFDYPLYYYNYMREGSNMYRAVILQEKI